MARADRRESGKNKSETLEQRVVRIDLEMLEIAKGHDGFLRGAPEPVIVAGLYSAVEDRLALIGRSVIRFAQPERIPSDVAAEEHELRVERRVAKAERFCAILCALEEDDGDGVGRAYELLAEPENLLCYRAEGEPEPISIMLDDAEARAIELFTRNRPFAEACPGDDWVAAAWVPVARSWTTHRVRFLSEKNDWTAVARSRA